MDFQKAILKIGEINNNGKETVQYHDMAVQYNPSSLSFSSKAGLIEEQGLEEAGLMTRKSAVLPPETTLRAELFFESVEGEDENADFVQKQVDGLLSLVMQAAGRQVVFVWGDMSFGGELEDVSAAYTMFDTKGNPIRANVSLSIRQARADSDERTNKSEDGYWEKAWKDFKKIAGKREESVELGEQRKNVEELLNQNFSGKR